MGKGRRLRIAREGCLRADRGLGCWVWSIKSSEPCAFTARRGMMDAVLLHQIRNMCIHFYSTKEPPPPHTTRGC